MKSFFTKLGGLLLCGVMFTAVGCHDYAEDIQKANDRTDGLVDEVNGKVDGVAGDLAALEQTVEALDATYATDTELKNKVDGLKSELETAVNTRIDEVNALITTLQGKVDAKAEKTEVDALTKKLNEEVSKLNTTIAALDAKYASKTEFEAAKTALEALTTKVSGIETTVASLNNSLETLDGEVEVLGKDLDAVEAEVAALESTLATVQGELTTAQKAIEDNLKEIAAIKENLKNEVARLEGKILENTNAIAEHKTSVQALIDALDAAVKANAKAIDDNKAAAEKALNEAVDALNLTIEAIKGDVAANKEAAEAAQNAADAAQEAADKAQAAAEAAQANADANEELIEANKTAAANAQDAADKAQAAADKAQEAAEAAQKTANQNAADIKKNAEAIDQVKADAKEALENAVTELEKADQDLNAELGKVNSAMEALAGRVEVLEGLVTMIQKVVYVPTNAKGTASLAATKLNDGTYSSAPSKISYKVYPNYLAREIAKAAVNPGAVTFDVVDVTKAAGETPFSIINIEGNDNGLLDITYIANQEYTSKLYTSATESFSSALVIQMGNDFYSTEYTNIEAGAETTISMVLKNVLSTPFAEEISYANIKNSYVVYPGVEPMFVLSTEPGVEYTAEELNDMGYGVKYEIKTVPTYSAAGDEDLFLISDVENTYAKNVTLAKNTEGTANLATDANIGANVNIAYTFESNVAPAETIDGTVAISDFPYTLILDGYVAEDYEISYVNGEASHVVLPGMAPLFQLGSETPVTEEDLVELGYAVKVNTVAEATAADDATKALFNVEGTTYPFTVSLAKDASGKILATAADVDKVLNVSYTFSALTQSINKTSKVTITKAKYVFDLAPAAATWNYMADAAQDALKVAGSAYAYTRDFTLDPVADQNDIKYAELPFAAQTVVVTDAADNTPAAGVTVTFAADKVTATGFEWGKTYNVVGSFEVTTAGVVGAEVTVNFSFSTARPADKTFTVALDPKTIDYTADLADVLVAGQDIAAICQIADENKGEGFTVAEWLKDVFVTNAPLSTEDMFNGAAPAYNSVLEIVADGAKIDTRFSYEEFTTTIPEKVTYKKTIETYYGQKVEFTQEISFTFPSYTITHNDLWVTSEGYTQVKGKFVMTGDKISGFSTEKVDMNIVFDKITKDGTTTVLAPAELAANSLELVYTPVKLVGEDADQPAFSGTIFNYNARAAKVGVDAKLYLVNANGAKNELKTNFATDYADYYVKQFNPLADEVIVSNKEVKLIAGVKNDVEVHELLGLNDVNAKKFIVNGAVNDAAYIYDSANNFYGVTLTYGEPKLNTNDAAAYVSVVTSGAADYTNQCTVTFDYTDAENIEIQQNVVVTIPVTYSHYWGEIKSEVVVTFVK